MTSLPIFLQGFIAGAALALGVYIIHVARQI